MGSPVPRPAATETFPRSQPGTRPAKAPLDLPADRPPGGPAHPGPAVAGGTRRAGIGRGPMQGAAVHAAGGGAQTARGERGPAGAVKAERPVEGIAHGEAVGPVERDQRGGDGEGEAVNQDADLRQLAVVLGGGIEAIGGVVGQAGGHGGNSFGGVRAGGRTAGHTHVGRRAAGRRRSRGRVRCAVRDHQGGAVIVAIGLTSAITSTSSRESLAKARQSATSASLS